MPGRWEGVTFAPLEFEYEYDRTCNHFAWRPTGSERWSECYDEAAGARQGSFEWLQQVISDAVKDWD